MEEIWPTSSESAQESELATVDQRQKRKNSGPRVARSKVAEKRRELRAKGSCRDAQQGAKVRNPES